MTKLESLAWECRIHGIRSVETKEWLGLPHASVTLVTGAKSYTAYGSSLEDAYEKAIRQLYPKQVCR